MKELLFDLGEILKKNSINQFIVGFHNYSKSKTSYSLTEPNIVEKYSKCTGIYCRFSHNGRDRYISTDLQSIDSLSKILNEFLRTDKALCNLSKINENQVSKTEFGDIHRLIDSKNNKEKIHTTIELIRRETEQEILDSNSKLYEFNNYINETVVNSIIVQGDNYFHANNFSFNKLINNNINVSELAILLNTTIKNAIESFFGYQLDNINGYLLFSGQASSVLVHEIFGHMFEGQKSWIFKGNVPYNNILTKLKLDVMDDPLFENGLANRSYDIFANIPEKMLLMKDGRLCSLISDCLRSYRIECLSKLPMNRLSNTIVIPNEESKLDIILSNVPFIKIESIKHAVLNPKSGVLSIITQSAYLVNKSGNQIPLKSFTISHPIAKFFDFIVGSSKKSSLFHGRCTAYDSELNYSTYAPDLLLRL